MGKKKKSTYEHDKVNLEIKNLYYIIGLNVYLYNIWIAPFQMIKQYSDKRFKVDM